MSDPSQPEIGRILITNDDGIEAEGLSILKEIAYGLAEDVWTCAPLSDQSGCGHGITVSRPLRIRDFGDQVYTVDGTPTDCVLLAVNDLMASGKPDFVFSGINHGSNIGDDVTYSGTLGAAMEATLLGVRAIGFSLQVAGGHVEPYWDTARAYAPKVVAKLKDIDWPRGTFFSVNFPNCPPDAVRGIKVCRHGTRKIGDQITHHTDPRGKYYTWIGPARTHATEPARDTDVSVIAEGWVTVTPLNLDLTHYEMLAPVAEVFS